MDRERVRGTVVRRATAVTAPLASVLLAGTVLVGLLSGSAGAAQSSAADQALANATLLQQSDIPGTWTVGAPDTQSTAGDQDQANFAKCLHVPNDIPKQTAFAGSDQFAQGDSASIYSATLVFETKKIVQSDRKGGNSKLLSKCLSKDETAELKAIVKPTTKITDLKVHRRTLPLGTCDSLKSVVAETNFNATVAGSKTHITADLWIVVVFLGRAESAVYVTYYDAPANQSVLDAAVTAVSKRLKSASSSSTSTTSTSSSSTTTTSK